MERTLQLYSLSLKESRTYVLMAGLLVLNMVIPYMVHLIPMGGKTWLPFYLLILIGSFKYGWKFGLLAAILSPLFDSLVLGLPSIRVLPVILMKCVLLSLIASYTAHKFRTVNLLLLVAVVVSYQALGFVGEMLYHGNLVAASSDIVNGWPGLVSQVAISWFVLKRI